MTAQKANLSVEVDIDVAERQLPFQPKPMQTYGEQVLEIIKRKNIPHKTVDVDSDGHIVVDKDKDPELYDWAVNG